MDPNNALAQKRSGGDSCPEVHGAALVAAAPRKGLRWLDIGCGTGVLLRMVLGSYSRHG